MNNVMLVGRLAQDIEVKRLETGREVTRVSIAVNKSFKNPDGVYEVDFIDCVLWDAMAKNIGDYCKKGDTVGVRGRLQTSTYEKDGQKHKVTEVVVERLTFLSSGRPDVEHEEKSDKKKEKNK